MGHPNLCRISLIFANGDSKKYIYLNIFDLRLYHLISIISLKHIYIIFYSISTELNIEILPESRHSHALRFLTRISMSIFFKFGSEAGEPQKVTCDGMDMSLLELKLAIKDLRGIKNITDFDLQVKR